MRRTDITMVEVGPRDGFQPIVPFIPTQQKVRLLQRLHSAGLRRIEATAFVSDKAVPQMADASEVLAAAADLPGLDVQVLVPNVRYGERAVEAGARHIAFVISVSEPHSRSNVRRSPDEAVGEYERLIETLDPAIALRLNVATAFDCPFDGPVAAEATLVLMDRLVPLRPDLEIALCDTTGRVTPDRVAVLFDQAMARYGADPSWVFHGHDTYGLGLANVLAAYGSGVRVFDASFAGLGGCPFAPGATGNVATEDVVWTLEQMGINTGVDLDLLLEAAAEAAVLPGANAGGRVRAALAGARCAATGLPA